MESLELRFGTGGNVSVGLLYGGSTNLCPGKVYGMAAHYSLSMTPPGLCLLLSPQQGLKVRMGKRNRKEKKDKTRQRTELNI